MQVRVFILIILQAFLLSCQPRFAKQKQSFEHYSLKGQPEQKRVNDSIVRYKSRVEAETGRVIAVAEDHLVREGAISNLGVFVCDALKFAGGKSFGTSSDIVLLNKGGLRSNIAKGDVKVSNIFELMPFENELVMMTVKGKDLVSFAMLLPEKRHPYSGMVVRLKKDSLVYVKVGGVAVDPEASYEIITSDYLAGGGDNFTFLAGQPVKTSGVKVRDAIIRYCEHLTAQNKTIKPYRDARLELSN